MNSTHKTKFASQRPTPYAQRRCAAEKKTHIYTHTNEERIRKRALCESGARVRVFCTLHRQAHTTYTINVCGSCIYRAYVYIVYVERHTASHRTVHTAPSVATNIATAAAPSVCLCVVFCGSTDGWWWLWSFGRRQRTRRQRPTASTPRRARRRPGNLNSTTSARIYRVYSYTNEHIRTESDTHAHTHMPN